MDEEEAFKSNSRALLSSLLLFPMLRTVKQRGEVDGDGEEKGR